jgi:hypothetical protein
MNKKHLLYGTAFIALVAMLLNTTRVNSEITKPPSGSAGDPLTNKTCAQSGCHPGAGNELTPTANDLTINIGTGTPTTPLNSSFKYDEGTSYNIAFLPNAFTGRYGFQIIALDASNKMAGTFTVTNAAKTAIRTVGTAPNQYQYMGHLDANNFKQWVFKWNAPAASTGNVTFYYSYNTADNDGTPNGDIIYKGSVTIGANPSTGINDLSSKVADLKVFPNPITSDFGLTFNVVEAMDLTVELYNLNGELVKNLMDEKVTEGTFTRNFNISDLAAGVYMVKLASGPASVTQKIFKQ